MAAETLAGLEDDNLLRRIRLAPLAPEALGELAAELLGLPVEKVPAGLVDWLADRSRGHPLFAISLLRALREEGADLAAPALDRLPESLRDRVAVELGHLEVVDRSLIEVLSVLDQDATAPERARLRDTTVVEAVATVERLCRAGLMVEVAHGAAAPYGIAHPLVQESVCQSMLGARHQSLHRTVARALNADGRIAAAGGALPGHPAGAVRPGAAGRGDHGHRVLGQGRRARPQVSILGRRVWTRRRGRLGRPGRGYLRVRYGSWPGATGGDWPRSGCRGVAPAGRIRAVRPRPAASGRAWIRTCPPPPQHMAISCRIAANLAFGLYSEVAPRADGKGGSASTAGA